MKKQVLRDPIYECPLTLYRNCTAEEFVQIAKKHGVDETPSTMGIWTNEPGQRSAVIVLSDRASLATVIHELIHHGVFALDISGIPINHDTDEALTHYVCFLLRQCRFISYALK